MKKIIYTTIAAILISSSTYAKISNPRKGWEFSIAPMIEANLSNHTVSINRNDIDIPKISKKEALISSMVGVDVGYTYVFSNSLAFTGNLYGGYRINDYYIYDYVIGDASGRMKYQNTISLGVNIGFAWATAYVTPFIKAGLTTMENKISLDGDSNNEQISLIQKNSIIGFEVIAGMDIKISENNFLELNYAYSVGFDDQKIRANHLTVSNKFRDQHSIKVLYKWAF